MNRKHITRSPRLKVPLFESGDVVFCADLDAWNALHRRLHANAGEGLTKGASHTLRSPQGTLHIIGVFNGKPSTLAHECAHIAFDICADVGVEVSPGAANETYCYLISRLFEFCSGQMKTPATT